MSACSGELMLIRFHRLRIVHKLLLEISDRLDGEIVEGHNAENSLLELAGTGKIGSFIKNERLSSSILGLRVRGLCIPRHVCFECVAPSEGDGCEHLK